MNRPRPQNVNLRPNPHTLGVTLLREGEVSRAMRVRAPREVQAWLAGLTPAQVGELLTRMWRELGEPAPGEGTPTAAVPAASPRRRKAPQRTQQGQGTHDEREQ